MADRLKKPIVKIPSIERRSVRSVVEPNADLTQTSMCALPPLRSLGPDKAASKAANSEEIAVGAKKLRSLKFRLQSGKRARRSRFLRGPECTRSPAPPYCPPASPFPLRPLCTHNESSLREPIKRLNSLVGQPVLSILALRRIQRENGY